MAETILIEGKSKEEKYKSLLPQLEALVKEESDLIANLSNIMSALKYGMSFFWVGIYFVKENELVLGPFQGPVACTRIAKGKGVCGMAWEQRKNLIVENVLEFPGHIACSSESKSEIVLSGFNSKREVAFVLDVDSDQLAAFDAIDENYLQEVVCIIEKKMNF